MTGKIDLTVPPILIAEHGQRLYAVSTDPFFVCLLLGTDELPAAKAVRIAEPTAAATNDKIGIVRLGKIQGLDQQVWDAFAEEVFAQMDEIPEEDDDDDELVQEEFFRACDICARVLEGPQAVAALNAKTASNPAHAQKMYNIAASNAIRSPDLTPEERELIALFVQPVL
jgi:hypothetical protein